MAELAQVRSGFVGLMTARSADATPPGGLLEAENVVIRKENTIEPRPGFQTSALPAATASGGALGRVEYPIETNEAGVIHDGTNTLWDGFSGESDVITNEDAGALAWRTYEGATARRSLYLCTADALRAVHSPGAAIAYRGGVPIPAVVDADNVASASTGPAFSAAGYRAYRAVARRDKNSASAQAHISRSAPSNRMLVQASADDNATLRVALHPGEDWQVGDTIELYSSEESETTPTDELYLNQEVAITTAHVAAGYVDLIDDRPDAQLGTALYTNESREGAEATNRRPPAAGCVGSYHNSLWLGDLTYPASEIMAFSAIYAGGAATANLIGLYAVNGTFTNGSAVITGVADTSDIRVGMLLYRTTGGYADSWSGTGKVRVTSIVANTSITVSETWGGATGAESPFFEDSIKIASEYYVARDIVAQIRGTVGPEFTVAQFPAAASSLYTAELLSDEFSYSPTLLDNRRREVLISTILASTTPPEIWATHGDLYAPALPEPSVVSGHALPQEVLPDHVAWSKRDEPDHFPLTQIDRVGRPGSTVMGLGESRNSILIATDQGLWRGSGYADSGISFDEVDKDVRALGKRCMAAAGTSQYVAADTGVFECDENQAVNITDLKVNDMEPVFFAVAETRVSSLKVVSNAKDDEILVCCPSSSAITDEITHAYVFNILTRAWTKWTFPASLAPDGVWDVTTKGPRRRLTGCASGLELNLLEKISTSTDPLADNFAFSVTVDTASGLGVTLTGAPAVALQAGDALIQSSVTYLITSVVSPTSFLVHATGLVAGAATPRAGYTCTITPSVNTLKTPQFMKVWGTGAIHWARRAGVYQYSLAFRSAITGSNTATSQTKILGATLSSNTDARSAPTPSPFLTPRGAARGTHLCFTITIRQALANWAIEQVSVRVRTTADKLPARLP
jgi:hypothetical protein